MDKNKKKLEESKTGKWKENPKLKRRKEKFCIVKKYLFIYKTIITVKSYTEIKHSFIHSNIKEI